MLHLLSILRNLFRLLLKGAKKAMPNIKSAIKRVDVNEKKNALNRSTKSKISTYTKKFKTALAENNIASAEELYKQLVSLLDSAANENVIHKNCASRRQAHFAKLLDDAKKA